MNSNTRLPYNQDFDYRYIKPIRHLRNKTLTGFSKYMNLDPATISKLENNRISFTPYYREKFLNAIRRLRVSNIEIVSVRKIIETKELKGYK